ncbi:MAG: hypothetical protein RMM16_00305 [Chloroherpetonaceae bacterium]|nr:hypothetical protein [Chloroherpetonaceae bacterium]
MNVAAWSGRFSRFIQETNFRPRYAASRPLAKSPEQEERSKPQERVSKEILDARWGAFIETLEREGKSFLVSHLQTCELEATEDGRAKLKCARKFSFESLQAELTRLRDEAKRFFGGDVEIEIALDKNALAETLKAEKSAAELFEELSKTNPVVQYLIEHFGAEPLY